MQVQLRYAMASAGNMYIMLGVTSNWLIVNKLVLNIGKPVCIIFGCYIDSIPVKSHLSIIIDC